MYERIGIQVSFALAVILSCTTGIANAEVRSNIKPIPKAFIGKWVGLNQTKQKSSKMTIKDLCNDSYYEDNAYVVEFNEDRQRLSTFLYLEEYFYHYPIFYTKYTPNHVAGQLLTVVFDLGSNDDLVGKNLERFDYKITNGELTVSYDYGMYYLTRCK